MPRPLRVLTANLMSGRARADALCEAIVAGEIDVACLQELGDGLSGAIREVLPHGHLAPNATRRGLGIASRTPVEVTPVPLTFRPGWAARVEAPGWGRALRIVNVHLSAPHAWPYFPRRARRRSRELRELLGFLDGTVEEPTAILGDFNATPIWPLYRKIARRYRDGAREASDRPPATWPNLGAVAARLGLAPFFRIDHCFLSEGVRCTRVVRVALPGSDHAGLCFELDVSASPDESRRAG